MTVQLDRAAHAAEARGHEDELIARVTFLVGDAAAGRLVAGQPGPANLGRVGGRGLLIRTFTDEASYNSTGNQITLVRRSARREGGEA